LINTVAMANDASLAANINLESILYYQNYAQKFPNHQQSHHFAKQLGEKLKAAQGKEREAISCFAYALTVQPFTQALDSQAELIYLDADAAIQLVDSLDRFEREDPTNASWAKSKRGNLTRAVNVLTTYESFYQEKGYQDIAGSISKLKQKGQKLSERLSTNEPPIAKIKTKAPQVAIIQAPEEVKSESFWQKNLIKPFKNFINNEVFPSKDPQVLKNKFKKSFSSQVKVNPQELEVIMDKVEADYPNGPTDYQAASFKMGLKFLEENNYQEAAHCFAYPFKRSFHAPVLDENQIAASFYGNHYLIATAEYLQDLYQSATDQELLDWTRKNYPMVKKAKRASPWVDQLSSDQQLKESAHPVEAKNAIFVIEQVMKTSLKSAPFHQKVLFALGYN
jgi:hypothetical protein